jgi:hypothetical protein
MMNNVCMALIAMLWLPAAGKSQCFVPPPPPPPCTGTETQVVADETLHTGTSKWYSGPAASFNSLYLDGGTLVVCGDLSVDKFYMDSGTIIIRPGARFVIGSGIGAGLILRGNSAIYNYGTCEIQRNLSLESGWATAAQPNLIVNASASSIFRMSNQYLVINNVHSWFVNNGDAEFWGTIQEPTASAGAVCLGDGSTTRMAVQINKAANAYSVPSGSACVQVRQFSQFFAAFTAQSGLRACLGSSHYSDSGCVPFGCSPNNWGAATVLTACSDCASFAVLDVRFQNWKVEKPGNGTHLLNWQAYNLLPGSRFRILRSGDGASYTCIDSLTVPVNYTQFFTFTDRSPLPGDNYYMIQYLDSEHQYVSNSKSIRVHHIPFNGLRIYPMPFQQQFYIEFDPQQPPRQLMMSDISGRNLRIYWYTQTELNRITVQVAEPLRGDLFLLHIRTDQSVLSRTLLHH